MRGISHCLRAVALLVSLLLSVAPIAAQPADESEQEASPNADELFDQGLQDMLDGKFETGCPALEKSYELEPLAGALFTLAECEAKWGKLATAMRRYQKYLGVFREMSPDDQAKQRGRDGIAQEQIDALRGAAPRVDIVMPADVPEGTVVRIDGEEIEAQALASGTLLVDPGSHTITIEVPGGTAPNEYEFEVVKNERTGVRLELPEGATVEEEDDGASIEFGLREGSYIVGGVGAVFLIVGIIAGGVTMGKKGTIDDNCDDQLQCTPEGLDAADSAETTGAVSTVGFVVGPALLGAAVVMFLLGGEDDGQASSDDAPSEEALRLRPMVAAPPGEPGGVLLGVSGAW